MANNLLNFVFLENEINNDEISNGTIIFKKVSGSSFQILLKWNGNIYSLDNININDLISNINGAGGNYKILTRNEYNALSKESILSTSWDNNQNSVIISANS